MDLSIRYRRNPDFVHRRVGEEEILVPVRRSGADLSSIYLLNPTGAAIWERLAEPGNGESLLEAVVSEFDVDRETAAIDLRRFLAELESVAAIQAEEGP